MSLVHAVNPAVVLRPARAARPLLRQLTWTIRATRRRAVVACLVDVEAAGASTQHPPKSEGLSPTHTSMQTRFLTEAQLDIAAELLRGGEVVAFPTETVYGLGADATNDVAVRSIYTAKGRPSDNPLIVHFESIDKAKEVVQVDEDSDIWKIARAFWPGPLTVVLPLRAETGQETHPRIAKTASGGLSTIGVRVPDNDVARRLIRLAGVPIAAPSANSSGKPSPTCSRHVADDLSGKIAAIIEGEVSAVGVESTIVDGTRSPLVVLRPGGITLTQLRGVVGDNAVVSCPEAHSVEEGSSDAPRAPGMKYVHYAPEAPVYFLEGSVAECQSFIQQHRSDNSGSKIALLTSLDLESVSVCGADSVVRCGEFDKVDTIARALYGCLRQFDDEEHRGTVGAIVCFGFPSDGVGEAVLNRLKKASQKA